MSKLAHNVYITFLVLIVAAVLAWLYYTGISYYRTPIEERFFHESHHLLKPSGTIGHGLGIIGSLLIIIGISVYMARKKFRSLSRVGQLKYWLEFHIFLCTLGSILILFHTSFKFGGIVSVSFWSMVAVFLSGVAGRFIYIQIPRTIEGRELSLKEVREIKANIGEMIKSNDNLDETRSEQIMAPIYENERRVRKHNFMTGYVSDYFYDFKTIRQIKSILRDNNIPKSVARKIVSLVKQDLSLNRRIGRLNTMQTLFKYWHVAHLPFAVVMILIMVVHVIIAITFGYKWIF